jgi:hypothetical protein
LYKIFDLFLYDAGRNSSIIFRSLKTDNRTATVIAKDDKAVISWNIAVKNKPYNN